MILEDPQLFPPTVEINDLLKKARFFLGDRWIEIGDVVFHEVGPKTFEMEVPDIGLFFAMREGLEDGTEEWYEWGPRVN